MNSIDALYKQGLVLFVRPSQPTLHLRYCNEKAIGVLARSIIVRRYRRTERECGLD